MALSLDEAIALVPGWGSTPLDIQPLYGGVTNRTYCVTVGTERFALRVDGASTAALGINRQLEYRATTTAASIGLAPDVIHFDALRGIMVTRFIDGHVWTWEEIHQPEIICRIAEVLRRVHALPNVDVLYSPFHAALGHVQTARRLGVSLPDDFGQLLNHVQGVEAALRRKPASPCLCHNDVVRRNFLYDGTVRLIDWEYAGMGDHLFDLVIVALNHQFSHEQQRLLLDAYGTKMTASDQERFALLKSLYHFREATWSLVQIGVADAHSDFDFHRLADEHFVALKNIIGIP